MTRQEAFEIVRGNESILQRVAARYASLAGSDAQTRATSALTTGTLPLTELVKEDARKIDSAEGGHERARAPDGRCCCCERSKGVRPSCSYRGISVGTVVAGNRSGRRGGRSRKHRARTRRQSTTWTSRPTSRSARTRQTTSTTSCHHWHAAAETGGSLFSTSAHQTRRSQRSPANPRITTSSDSCRAP